MKKFFFSDKCQKKSVALFSKNQERNLVVTDSAVYNFKGNEMKIKINIESLKAITISNTSNQMIIHFIQDFYDYLIIYPDRKKLIKVLQSVYKSKKNQDLLFCKKNDQDLSQFVVTRKERTKNPYLFKINQNELSSIKDYIDDDGGSSKISQSETNNKLNKVDNNIDNSDIYNSNRIINLLNELYELKSKLPYQMEDKEEKLIFIIFQSSDQQLNIPMICKNTEQFCQLERKIYKIEKYKEYKDERNVFVCNGKKIDKLETLYENNIKNGDTILLIQQDE